MRPGRASVTAQRVAAHRLTFERVAVPFGDGGADDRLARDVAGRTDRGGRGPMVAYLAGRTAFFDRVVVAALGAGVGQVVVAAAGYDGRAFRYAKPGVRWFEVDHPDTQRDKLERLSRLGIDTRHVAFVAADFTSDDVAGALAAAGHDATRPSLFLCEGVAVYLDQAVLESLLRLLRAAAADGSRLAISLSVSGTGAARRRLAFRATVAAVGEPARSLLTAADADALFAATGWQAVPDAGRERARAAGFIVATTNPTG